MGTVWLAIWQPTSGDKVSIPMVVPSDCYLGPQPFNLSSLTIELEMQLGRMTQFSVDVMYSLWSWPQRRQDPYPLPMWLLVGTPEAFGPRFAYRLHVAQPTLMGDPIYFYILLYYYMYIYLCTTFLWPLRLGWLLVLSLYRRTISMYVLLITRLLRLVGGLSTRKPESPHPKDGCCYSN